jgi:transposase InsO family protein
MTIKTCVLFPVKAIMYKQTGKQEYYIGSCFKSKGQAEAAVKEAVNLYNTRRPHTSLDYETPEKMHGIAA